MTPSPVLPDDANALIVSPTNTFCTSLVRVFLKLPLLFYQYINWAITDTGAVSNEFKQQLTPPGTLLFSASAVAPADYLLCNGAIVARATYEDLFDAISTTYGAGNDDGLTFTLPDYRGRFPIGVGQTTGLTRGATPVTGDTYSLGDMGGEKDVVLTMEDLPSEPPPLGDKADDIVVSTASFIDGETKYSLSADNVNIVKRNNSNDDHADNVLGDLGTDNPHNNIPPFIACFIYVKI